MVSKAFSSAFRIILALSGPLCSCGDRSVVDVRQSETDGSAGNAGTADGGGGGGRGGAEGGGTAGVNAAAASGTLGASGTSGAGGMSGATGASGAADASGTGGSGGTGGRPDAAMPCDEVSDCGDPARLVCDPKTATCGPSQCTDTKACASNERCFYQNEIPPSGVCYPMCELAGTPCAAGATCVPHWGGPSGSCVPAGSTPADQPCVSRGNAGINTGCVTGQLCTTDGPVTVCKAVCDAWGAAPRCANGQCFMGRCRIEGDSAAVGDACQQGDGRPCARGTYAWQGICANDSRPGSYCFKLCRTNVPTDCPSGAACYPFVANGPTGVCQ